MSLNNVREVWKSRLGLIMAMAGNAIGLGNFLRFPVQAAANGGGAFMIPYFIAFLVVGIPMMWVEWSVGRFGGKHGHGTTPGIPVPAVETPGRQVHRRARYRGAGRFRPVLFLRAVVDPGLQLLLPDRPVLRYLLTGGDGRVPEQFPGRHRKCLLQQCRHRLHLLPHQPGHRLLGAEPGRGTGHRDPGQVRHAHAVDLCDRAGSPGTDFGNSRSGLSRSQRHGRIRLDLEPGPQPSYRRRRVARGRGTDLLLPWHRHRQHAVLRELRPRPSGRRPHRPDHFHEQRLRRGGARQFHRDPGRRGLLRRHRHPRRSRRAARTTLGSSPCP